VALSPLSSAAGKYILILSRTIPPGDGGSFFYQAEQAAPGKKHGLRTFVYGPAVEQDCWGILDDSTIHDECQLLSQRIAKLCHDGLTGIDTIHCWLSRRIQPLQYRPSLMCEYSCIDDVQRFTKEVLTPE
jgi:hypothetical protein